MRIYLSQGSGIFSQVWWYARLSVPNRARGRRLLHCPYKSLLIQSPLYSCIPIYRYSAHSGSPGQYNTRRWRTPVFSRAHFLSVSNTAQCTTDLECPRTTQRCVQDRGEAYAERIEIQQGCSSFLTSRLTVYNANLCSLSALRLRIRSPAATSRPRRLPALRRRRGGRGHQQNCRCRHGS